MVAVRELLSLSTSHGQKFLRSASDDDLIERVAAIDPGVVQGLEAEAQFIFRSVQSDRSFPMPISLHELSYALRLKNDADLLQYLAFRHRFYTSGRDKVLFDAPPYILVEPVSACNLRCPMCFQVDKTFTRRPYMGVMKWDLFTKVIDEAAELEIGAITLASRGEPTMHPRFADMLTYIAEHGRFWEVKVNTNGTFLTPEIARAIFSTGVTQFVVSADHYEKTAYEKLRVNADFDEVLNNVIATWKIKQTEFPDCRTEMRISGVKFSESLDEGEFVKFWERYSDSVTLAPAITRWDTYNNEPHKEISSPCIFLWDRMYIWFDGATNPCDQDYKSLLSYGNVRDITLKEAWHGEKISRLREMHMSGSRGEINPCDRCGLDFRSDHHD